MLVCEEVRRWNGCHSPDISAELPDIEVYPICGSQHMDILKYGLQSKGGQIRNVSFKIKR